MTARVLALALAGVLPLRAAEFFVATNGLDTNPGTPERPFASPEAARNAARPLAGREPVTIWLCGGRHELAQPLALTPADSGSESNPVVWSARPGETAVLSGGRVLQGFRRNGRLWETTLADVKEGRWYFRQLFVNGQRRTRARSPDEGYFRIAGFLPGPADDRPGVKPYARDRFRFAPGDLKPWAQLGDVNLVLMHSWETSIHPVQSVDVASNLVTLAAPLKEWWGLGYWEEHPRYYVENARELLDAPGEWYLDRESGVLSYWPLPGEKLETAGVVAPRLPELLRVTGDAVAGRIVSNIVFRNIAFHHADWILDPKGNSSTQAAVEVPAALTLDGAERIDFERCEVAHIGTYGLWYRRGCRDGTVRQCRFHDLGAGAVRVGEDRMAVEDAAETRHIRIDNNHVFGGGRVYAGAVGLWIAQSSSNTVSHNDIHDLPYSGISIGWNWDLATNRTHHNVVEYNHVHDLGHGVLSDAGLIYCLGVSPGSAIRNNVFHDLWPYETPGYAWGIYLDSQCGGYFIESNVVYNTRNGGLMFNNGGHQHTIRNNVFALFAHEAIWPYAEKRPSTLRNNIVLMTQGSFLVAHSEATLNERIAAGESPGNWDANLYWHTGGAERVRFYRHTFAEWQALGLDRNSLVADPQFASLERRDFRFGDASPAAKLGIRPIDASTVGLYGDPAWAAEAQHARCVTRPLPPAPPPPPAREIDDDFESTAVGERPAHAIVAGETSGASIRVSDERATGGRHSLKIADTAATQPFWQPHVYYAPSLTTGLVRQSFDLWLDGRADLFTEWRDVIADYPRCVGPSIRFDGQGRVTASGRELTRVPVGAWFHVDIEARLSAEPVKSFALTVTTPDQAPQRFAELPISGTSFRELHWLGITSPAATGSCSYVDNLKVKRQP